MLKNRYEKMFESLPARGEGAFVPFAVVGDPSLNATVEIADALIAGGSDALELGIPFSDPVADGPTIQAASQRALDSGANPSRCFEAIGRIRAAHESTPIGVLVYANTIEAMGMEVFYEKASMAGIDSVLVADLPVFEAEPYVSVAKARCVCPVFVAPFCASESRIASIAALTRGYTYVVARSGVTGADPRLRLRHGDLFSLLKKQGAPPPILGFGISKPEHVREALAAGAAGAIAGSAVVSLIAAHSGDGFALRSNLELFARDMKAATRSSKSESGIEVRP